VAYQSDIDALAGLRLGASDRSFEQFFEAHYMANREHADRDVLLTTPQVRGGLSLGF
jgi:hypothetical protein